jgi:hypothetical protein
VAQYYLVQHVLQSDSVQLGVDQGRGSHRRWVDLVGVSNGNGSVGICIEMVVGVSVVKD